MGKRKHPESTSQSSRPAAERSTPSKKQKKQQTSADSTVSNGISSANGSCTAQAPGPSSSLSSIHLQVIASTYEKILHGCLISIPTSALNASNSTGNSDEQDLPAAFTDTFLFTAHTAPLRCVALSPAPDANSKDGKTAQKRILASGSPDEKINLYTLSTTIPPPKPASAGSVFGIPSVKPTAQKTPKAASISNKHLGTLHEHTNTVTTLLFTPSRTKLLSAGEDNCIHIWRVRDWELLSTLKVPKPKQAVNAGVGALGGALCGVNDLAVHPSQKILLSVSRGEKCLRMWNLMTGKKAGVLAYDRNVVTTALGGVTKDGKKIDWNGEGTNFAVGFERGAVVYGQDSLPFVRILPGTKLHQMRYLRLPTCVISGDAKSDGETELLALGTEDGRILFYDPSSYPQGPSEPADINPVAQLGGKDLGMPNRIKDFVLLSAPTTQDNTATSASILVTACSDGTLRVWTLDTGIPTGGQVEGKDAVKRVGRLLGVYKTERRVTGLEGMVMGIREGDAEEEEEAAEESDSDSEEDDDDDDDDDDDEE